MDTVIMLELHGFVEANALVAAMQKRLDELANGYTRNHVIEYLALQQIAARLSPQVDALVEQEQGSTK